MNATKKATRVDSFHPIAGHSNALTNASDITKCFVADELPVLNRDVNQGRITPENFIDFLKPVVDRLCDAFDCEKRCRNVSLEGARSVLQLLGFIVSSAERHFQARGEQKGHALKMLGKAESTMLQAGLLARHPPRDSAYSYWVWNAGARPLTFTGSAQEAKFNEVINKSDQAFKEACEFLRPICRWDVSLEDAAAEDLLSRAAVKMATLRDDFMSLMRHKDGPHSERALEPMFFMTEMRLYLIGYPVGGREWEGVSAANLASQMSVDFLVGTTEEAYAEHVRGRFEYFPDEERAALEADMASDSVLTVFLRTMGITLSAVEGSSDSSLRALVSGQSLQLQRSLAQYKALVKAAAYLTASHWSLIDNYLLKPSKKLGNTEHAHLVVDPEKGTSGMSMEDVKRIREMRRNHSIAGKLIECV